MEEQNLDLSRYLIKLKGKDYLLVAGRIISFRAKNPDWSLMSSYESPADGHWLARCRIINAEGRLVQEATKEVHLTDGKSAQIENPWTCAETGAIGRALAFLGFGTSLALDDISEGDNISDAPIATTKGKW